jgi:hypothetical protein
LVAWIQVVGGAGLSRNLTVAGFMGDRYRLVGLLVGCWWPIVAVGASVLLGLVNRGVRRLRHRLLKSSARGWRGLGQVVSPLITAVLMVGLVAMPLTSLVTTTTVDTVNERFAALPDPASTGTSVYNLVSANERTLIEALPELIDMDKTVAGNPWNGSSMAYALVGVTTTTTAINHAPTPDEVVINELLNQVSEIPDEVCPAVQELNVGYVLDFGGYGVQGWTDSYTGLTDLDQAEGFTLIERRGSAVLYQVDACQEGVN